MKGYPLRARTIWHWQFFTKEYGPIWKTIIGTLIMYLELYQKETEKLAERNGKLLKELRNKLMQNPDFSLIEEQAMLHALQIIIENAIGKARHLLKTKNEKCRSVLTTCLNR
jgi:Mlc titration factor MtfA (ptsG expression regulator)